MLSDDGEFSVVLPYDAAGEFERRARDAGLYMIRRTDVVTVAGHEPKRSLLTFSATYAQPECSVLNMREEDGNESAEYIGLVKDFYLKY